MGQCGLYFSLSNRSSNDNAAILPQKPSVRCIFPFVGYQSRSKPVADSKRPRKSYRERYSLHAFRSQTELRDRVMMGVKFISCTYFNLIRQLL